MSVYATDAIDREAAVDECHAELVRAMVECHKPKRVLELGFGTGRVTRAVLDGLRYNGQEYTYDLVDNWLDFGGTRPQESLNCMYDGVTFIAEHERVFVRECSARYDMIFSDADHRNTHEWWHDYTYRRLLLRPGILFYHDVTNSAFPNLRDIRDECVQRNLPHVLFDRNSRPGERCDRGLLAVFKQ